MIQNRFLSVIKYVFCVLEQPETILCRNQLFWIRLYCKKHGTEYIRGLRHKPRMTSIQVDCPCYIFGNNMSVLYYTTFPESTLKKNSKAVAYYFVCKGVSIKEWLTTYVNTLKNPADILTKVLRGGQKRMKLVHFILYDIYP